MRVALRYLSENVKPFFAEYMYRHVGLHSGCREYRVLLYIGPNTKVRKSKRQTLTIEFNKFSSRFRNSVAATYGRNNCAYEHLDTCGKWTFQRRPTAVLCSVMYVSQPPPQDTRYLKYEVTSLLHRFASEKREN